MSRLYPTNFAFEVDLEKMEGRFLFDIGESEPELAEKKLLECCSYNNIIIAGCRQESELLEIDSSEVLGLTMDKEYTIKIVNSFFDI